MTRADAPTWQRPFRAGLNLLRRTRAEARRIAGIRLPEPELGATVRLPLPAHLIALDSAEGAALLEGSAVRGAYDRLMPHYVPQRNPNFCGPATIAMILNTLGVGGGRRFDQDNVFTRRTEAVRGQGAIVRQGMNLATLGGYLAAHGLGVEVHQAGQSSLDGVPRGRGRRARRRRPLRGHHLCARGAGAGGARPRLAARRVPRRHRPLSRPRRIASQVPARVGRGGAALRRDEHRRRQVDPRLPRRGSLRPAVSRRAPGLPAGGRRRR